MSRQSCPKCDGTLQPQQYAGEIEYAKCDGCAGLLMSELAFEELRNTWLSESIVDPVPFPVGRAVDEITKIICPVCEAEMTTLVDPQQSHVCLDCCQSCELLYFDAGEFTDLKQLTLMDYIWSFLAKLKN